MDTEVSISLKFLEELMTNNSQALLLLEMTRSGRVTSQHLKFEQTYQKLNRENIRLYEQFCSLTQKLGA